MIFVNVIVNRLTVVCCILNNFLTSSLGNERNGYLTIMVCKTADECDRNTGAACATYSGPPADPKLPVTLACGKTLSGEFMRVRQQIVDGSWLSLCEALIYSN